MKRGRRGGLLVALATLLGCGVSPFACSSSAGLSGKGGPCSQFSDCQEDLICGKGPNGAGVCTNDPSSLVPAQGGGADSGANPGSMPAGDSAVANGQGDSSVPPGDGQVPEEASPPKEVEVRDAGKPEDSGRPEDTGKPEDTGQPEDTGTPPQEAAAMPDAGGTDAGSD